MATTLQERLTAAEAAYHDLMMGKSVVEVRDANGETVRYNPTTASKLQAYIQNLRTQISGLPQAPMRSFFA